MVCIFHTPPAQNGCYNCHFITELPDDTPIIDLHKLAGIDLEKLPKIEKSGERMLRNVKEWMLKEKSSSECAVLLEDTLQRILVGVSIKVIFNELKFMIIFSQCQNSI